MNANPNWTGFWRSESDAWIVGFLYTLVQRDRAENKKESKEHGYGLRNPGIR